MPVDVKLVNLISSSISDMSRKEIIDKYVSEGYDKTDISDSYNKVAKSLSANLILTMYPNILNYYYSRDDSNIRPAV